MNALIDDISRAIASPVSRREAFRMVTGAVGTLFRHCCLRFTSIAQSAALPRNASNRHRVGQRCPAGALMQPGRLPF